MARLDASDLAQRLGRQAEAVCRRYLYAGRRHGNYWQVGDVRNTPGRSMFVRLKDSPKGPAGKWQDAATSERGDLLDVIREISRPHRLRRGRGGSKAFSQFAASRIGAPEEACQYASAIGFI